MSLAIGLLLLGSASAAPTHPDPRTVYDALAVQVAAAFDTSRGAFVGRAGVPHESAIELAFLRGSAGEKVWKDQALRSVTWARSFLDTIGGGYYHGRDARGSGDEALGKRTDVNALRMSNLVRAWRASGDDRHQAEAAKVVDFMERVLLDGRGGFVTAQVGDRDLDPEANGVALQAWLRWSASGLDRRRRDFALRSLDRVWETSWQPDLGLVVANSFGEVLRAPRLDDQVEMGRAYVLAYQLCRRKQDRERASLIGNLMIARFTDPEGGFRSEWMPRKHSIRKAPRESRGNARAARFLYELAALTGDTNYRAAADRAWEPFRKGFAKLGLDAADWALAARAAYAPEKPEAPAWANADDDAPPPRPRSVRIKLGRY